MSDKAKSILTFCALAGMAATLFYGYFIQKNAINEIEKAHKEADEANDRFVSARQENEELAKIIAGYKKAGEVEAKAVQEAESDHESRDDSISQAPDCWASIELPECVRKAFDADCVCTEGDGASSDADGILRQTEPGKDGE